MMMKREIEFDSLIEAVRYVHPIEKDDPVTLEMLMDKLNKIEDQNADILSEIDYLNRGLLSSEDEIEYRLLR